MAVPATPADTRPVMPRTARWSALDALLKPGVIRKMLVQLIHACLVRGAGVQAVCRD